MFFFLFSIIFNKNVKTANKDYLFYSLSSDCGKIMVLTCIGKTPPVGVFAFWGGRITLLRGVKRPSVDFFQTLIN